MIFDVDGTEEDNISGRDDDSPYTVCLGTQSYHHVVLLCMHILQAAVKNISCSALLLELPILLPLILPAFKSPLVDVRKAVVFVLVEMYMVVGDSLHCHVSDLTPPQKKLLTIYIDRQMSQRSVQVISTM